MTELRKEIAKLKELNTHLTEHTTEVESRLSKSDTHSSQLLGQIERNEKVSEEREKAYRNLEKHIAVLDTTQDNKLLLEQLELKDRRIADLETELGTFSVTTSDERDKLNGALEAERALHGSLRAQLAKSQSDTSSHFKDLSGVAETNVKETLQPTTSPSSASHKDLTPPDTPQPATPTAVTSDDSTSLHRALEELAAKCNEAETRALAAENKVSDLTSQLSEVRLIREEMDDVMPHSPVPLSARETDEMSDSGHHLQTPVRINPSPSPTRQSPIRPSPVRRSSVPTLSAVAGSSLRRDFRSSRGLTDIRRSR